MSFHRFSYEFQCGFAIVALRHVRLQHFTFMIDGSPEVMHFAVDFHENLIQMPLPVRVCPHPINPISTDLGREHRAKSVPPKSDSFVSDIDPSLVQKTLNIAERERKSNVHHDGQPDDLVLYKIWLLGYWKPLPATPFMAGSGGGWIEMIWAGSKIPEWVGCRHYRTLSDRPAPLKRNPPDTARAGL